MIKTSELIKILTLGSKEEIEAVISHYAKAPQAERDELFASALAQKRKYYGDKIFFRGLIEISNYCKNDCLYCGIRRSNKNTRRYRLSHEEILGCCAEGYRLGFRTFVMQGGEDSFFTDEWMCKLISEIKSLYPECAVTLSLGERSDESYRKLHDAGADRYLLRHETATESHYNLLHPKEMSLSNRIHCLNTLKEIGFQVGAGIMIESPYQTFENLAADMIFLRELEPHMVGAGPFIPHRDTVFAGERTPDAKLTLIMLALIRIMLPKVLLPATTALGTIDPVGRESGFQAGANVVMPNLSPTSHRKDYALYDNKLSTGAEASEGLAELVRRIKAAGFEPDFSRGDSQMTSSTHFD